MMFESYIYIYIYIHEGQILAHFIAAGLRYLNKMKLTQGDMGLSKSSDSHE